MLAEIFLIRILDAHIAESLTIRRGFGADTVTQAYLRLFKHIIALLERLVFLLKTFLHYLQKLSVVEIPGFLIKVSYLKPEEVHILCRKFAYYLIGGWSLGIIHRVAAIAYHQHKVALILVKREFVQSLIDTIEQGLRERSVTRRALDAVSASCGKE